MKRWFYLLVLLILLEGLSTALYLGTAGQPGFPLDDAWIHQTYARNLGLHGQMAFSPDQPSTGSTSPGWTTLLAAGYLFGVSFFAWAYLWGSIFAVATALAAALLSHRYFANFKAAVIVAVICILEWHLAWAALSGMEISLFTFLTLLILLILYRNPSPVWMGLVIGISFLVRPEAILFVLIYGLKLYVASWRHPKQLFTAIGIFGVVFLMVVGPWLIFNLRYSGRPLPSTITAKFMEYGYPPSLPNSLNYLLEVFLYFLAGPLMLLLPCVGLTVYNTFRERRLDLYYPLFWPLGLIALYAVALPRIYHHGRYLMPLIPVIVIFGVQGFFSLLEKLSDKSILRPAIWVAVAGMLIALWINGASTFAIQIKLLTEIHLQAARWLDAHTPKDTVIGTHDIGIIGYVTQRQIVDLAGLITPEVIPIMNDQVKLARFVREKEVSYLVVFSGYHKEMLDELDAQLVFSPGAEHLKELGAEPFEVYVVGHGNVNGGS
jgi:hypothetical protein